MRLKLVLVVIVLAMFPASEAKASPSVPCWCAAWFADSYVIGAHHDWTRTFTDTQFYVKGLGPVNRKRMRDGIYDWQKQRDFSASWCRDNKRACNAVKACLLAAGAAVAADYSKAVVAGKSPDREAMAIDGAYACAAAAATALAIG